MLIENRITAFYNLGHFFSQFSREKMDLKKNVKFNDLFFEAFKLQIKRAKETNSWFTQDNVLFAIESWSKILTKGKLTNWISHYNAVNTNQKTVAVIMAGNIPLVGFHDFLSVLISGHKILVKQSSNDKHFLRLVAKYLEHVEPKFKGLINFTDAKLENFDAVIATGSNNTARYFDYYFGKYPHIIRQNRNAVAIINGHETKTELEQLGEDIFRYFGLGCRSVSKIFVPKNYDFDLFFNAIFKYNDIINYQKYDNNYTYNKAVYLMSLFKLLENGFLMLKEDPSYSSPIATLFYEFYDDLEQLKSKLIVNHDKIQVVVSNIEIKNAVKFGETQQPQLADYADGVDTINFLLGL